jgi:hypothetical protein
VNPYLPILLIILISQSLKAQESVYLDEKGNTLSKTEFDIKWQEESHFSSTWHYKDKDNKHYIVLKNNLYLTGIFDYTLIKKKLEIITQRKIKNNSIILLEYYFKNDLCSEFRDNTWVKREILDRKQFLSPIRKKIIKTGITFFCLFEEGMILKNNTKNKAEYFFMDNGDFFRKNIFENQASCGSYMLIKPNGETLIRNGEYRPDAMVEHLKSKNWSIFFDE